MSQARLYPDWKDVVAFGSDGPQPQKLLETETLATVLVGLEAGQKIPTHPAPVATYHFLEGTGWMTVDGERFAVKPGATLVVPGGTPRGVEAETRLVFLGVRAAY